jgi:hypothetical protein
MTKELIKAIAYLRTSSRTNTGPDKDSDKRQREAIAEYAKAAPARRRFRVIAPAPIRAATARPSCSGRGW